ncbi:MAG TPA: hypothetical protein VIL46_15620, partial [Gemmataceae bacterium]
MGVPFVSRLRGLLARLRRRLRDRWRGETAETYFDIHNLKELNPVLRRHDCPPLEPGAAQAEEGVAGAARFVLALLARSPRLRRRFPRALSEGPGGAFFRWVIDRLGLSERARKHVAEAFAANLSRRVRRVYELRSDLREAFPFGLTPRQRGEYLGWLLRHGRADFGLRGEEVLWFLFET